MPTFSFPKLQRWLVLLCGLLALGGFLRLLDLTDPPLDFHPTRQLRNALVARAIYYELLPQADPEQRDLARSFSHAVGQYEPPIIETIVALTFLVSGGESYAVPRLWQTFFWLLAGIALFDLARRATSPWAALLVLAFYLVLPFSVQASRSFQPDPLMTSLFVIGLYFLYRWSEEQEWKWATLAGFLLGLSVLVKVVIAFLVGGAAVTLVWFTLGKRSWRSAQVWLMIFLMVVPALAFYLLANPERSTEYFFDWTISLLSLVTTTKFYARWLGFLGSLFGLTLLFLSIAGALLAPPSLRAMLLGLWSGYVLYGLTLPFQMYTHSYYHLQLVPVIALGLASPAALLVERASSQPRLWQFALGGLVLAVIGYHAYVARSILLAKDFRHEPQVWANIGNAIPPRAKVIALTQDYGYRLMYFGWCKADLWPLVTPLAELKGQTLDAQRKFEELTADKDYFLVTAFNQLEQQPVLKEILAHYPVVAKGEGFVLYDLRR
ncbi:MAG: ArnT family glycosyltransferase [Anaerolineales bacterium]